jgi:DNA polymerase IV
MRNIIHVDMNAFYASCHQAQTPAWRGNPLLVAGDPKRRHGIILTASYEARRCGVKTAMPVWQAKKLCPQGIFVPPDHELYLDYSLQILRILQDYSPLVEPYSIDEAWLDVTGCGKLLGDARDIGRSLQQRIDCELDIPCSVGISSNKFLAKMASERQKPRGLTIIYPQDVPEKIWPLPVSELVGVGRNLAPALGEMGVETIGQLAAMPVKLLVSRFGIMGEVLFHFAHGRDESPVDPQALESVKSIGHSLTLPRDISDPRDVDTVLLGLSEKVGRRLRQREHLARTITLTVKDHNFVTATRSLTLSEPTCLTDNIYRTARGIYRQKFEPWRKVRLLGISVSSLVKAEEERQMRLWGQDEYRQETLDKAVDNIRTRFGESALLRARLYRKEKNKDQEE